MRRGGRIDNPEGWRGPRAVKTTSGSARPAQLIRLSFRDRGSDDRRGLFFFVIEAPGVVFPHPALLDVDVRMLSAGSDAGEPDVPFGIDLRFDNRLLDAGSICR